MDGPGVRQVPEGSGEQGKMEKTGCKIICGAPTTLAVKGLMMMMMMMIGTKPYDSFAVGEFLALTFHIADSLFMLLNMWASYPRGEKVRAC